MSMKKKKKKSTDTIGNRTRELPVCTAVSQPTAPPHIRLEKNGYKCCIVM
jgi:hypothetical protein